MASGVWKLPVSPVNAGEGERTSESEDVLCVLGRKMEWGSVSHLIDVLQCLHYVDSPQSNLMVPNQCCECLQARDLSAVA